MGYMVNLVLQGRSAVVVGGGRVASRKVEDLLAARAGVTVVAPRPCPRILELAEAKRIAAQWRPYRTEDLRGAFVAIAAADDEAVNAQVASDAVAMNVLVNVVDRPALCTFTVPATVHRGALTLGVATDGRCPALAGVLRAELEQRYASEYAGLTDLFGELRKRMIEMGWDSHRIREAIARMYRDGAVKAISDQERPAFDEFLRSHLGSDFPLPPSPYFKKN